MSGTAHAAVGFVDRRENGRYPVLGANGGVIAQIRVPWSGRRFTATSTGGQLLCSGAPVSFTRTYEVSDAAGAPLVTVRSNFWNGNKKRTITFADGRELWLQGASWPGRDWAVTDRSGRPVLRISTTAGMWSLHPDAYVVKVADPQLSLAHVIGIVQANRILVKTSRNAAT